MNITMIDEPETTALTLLQRAAVALGSDKARRELALLALKSAHVDTIKNAAGREECHSFAMALKAARTNITRLSKEAREDAVKFGKAVIAEEASLILHTEPEEKRLLALRDAWDEKVAAEKEARAVAERARVIGITTRIAEIRGYLTLAQSARTSARVEVLQTTMQTAWGKVALGESAGFEEFTAEAEDAFNTTFSAMTAIVLTKRAEEVEAARVKLEAEAEAKRQKDIADANAIEAKRLADERAAFETEQALFRAQQAAAAPVKPVEAAAAAAVIEEALGEMADSMVSLAPDTDPNVVDLNTLPSNPVEGEVIVLNGRFTRPALKLATASPRPSDTELLDGLAEHFCVSDLTALSWLLSIDLKALQGEFAGEAA